ncbi:MAG: hypothetical protein KDJ55_01700 [Rhodobiaceae bacterium]|nr:hypothetical protein [Rhodobiaceae bacterium]MCC0013586.1 hypothetical protein [Rhodobiaceae bacterium]MCC0018300.1 hypothetical protein [Rhodobiaceae bacterium]MCC0060619.1 hypothetical protein [Rhodobiaceae bacterium]
MTEPVEPGRQRFLRGASAPIIMCLLAIALSVGAGMRLGVVETIAKSVSGPCAHLDKTRLDPLNPAQRACYCQVDGGHDVCRMEMVTGSIK